jgi:hypothetical protein
MTKTNESKRKEKETDEKIIQKWMEMDEKNIEKNVKESNATKESDSKNTSRLTYMCNMKEKNE